MSTGDDAPKALAPGPEPGRRPHAVGIDGEMSGPVFDRKAMIEDKMAALTAGVPGLDALRSMQGDSAYSGGFGKQRVAGKDMPAVRQ